MALARFQFTVTDQYGNVVPSASIEVRRETAGQPLVSLYSDRAGATPKGNPFTADADGFAFFHVAGGAFQVKATSAGFERIWRYVAVGLAGESDGVALQAVFSAHRNSVNQTGIVSGAFTKVLFTAADFDVGGNFAASTFTAPVNGYYLLNGAIAFLDLTAGAVFQGVIYKNGAAVLTNTSLHGASTDTASRILSTILYMDAGDTAELYCYQASGSDKEVRGEGRLTRFSGSLLSEA